MKARKKRKEKRRKMDREIDGEGGKDLCRAFCYIIMHKYHFPANMHLIKVTPAFSGFLNFSVITIGWFVRRSFS